MEKIITLGRYFFAAAMLASGVQQLLIGDFVRLVPALPAWIPWPQFWACLVGAILVAAGLVIALEKGTRGAATVLGAMLR